MAKKSPVRICKAKQIPARDPMFHQKEILEGAGRSTSALFITLRRG